MTDQTFNELVAGMRASQRRYFRTRTDQAKRESIVLEQAVDEALKVPEPTEFHKTVQRMRTAQVRYFKTLSPMVKSQAIAIEKIIDEHLATIVPDENGMIQQELF